jgi:streptogramin lyase
MVRRADNNYSAARIEPWQTVAMAAQLGSHSAPGRDQQGRTWFFTNSGNISAYTADGQLLDTISVPGSSQLKADPGGALVAVGPHNELWVASKLDDAVLVKLDQGTWTTFHTVSGLTDLVVDGQGIGWIMTGRGLYKIDPHAPDHNVVAAAAPNNLNAAQNPGADIPQVMTVDGAGRFWIAYGDGNLYGTVDGAQWTKAPTKLISVFGGGVTIRTACLAVDAQGQPWVCEPGGVDQLGANGEWQGYEIPTELRRAYGSLNSVAMDADGNIWLGTDGAGLLLRDSSGAWKAFMPDNAGIDSTHIRVVAVGDQSTVWGDTGSNLYILSGKQVPATATASDQRPLWHALAAVVLLAGMLLALASIPGFLKPINIFLFATPFVALLVAEAIVGLLSRSNDEGVFFFFFLPAVVFVPVLAVITLLVWRNRWVTLGIFSAIGFYALGTALIAPAAVNGFSYLYPFYLPIW